MPSEASQIPPIQSVKTVSFSWTNGIILATYPKILNAKGIKGANSTSINPPTI